MPVAALALSLFMHALLLTLPTSLCRRPTTPDAAPATPVMKLTLRPIQPATSPDRADGAFARNARSARATRPIDGQTARPSPSASRESREPMAALEIPASPGEVQHEPLDVDALRAQARDYARQAAKPPFGASDVQAASATRSAPIDRPQLEALARRIGRPLHVASEQRLPDGSWRIRFAGGVCMHVPRELPVALDNAFGPNIALPTNCSD